MGTLGPPPEPTLKEVRERLGTFGGPDDGFLLRCFLRPEEIESMQAAGPPKDYLTSRHPLTTLIQRLTMRTGSKFIRIQKGDFSLTLRRR